MDIDQLRTLKSVHPKYEERVDIGNIKTDMTYCAGDRARDFLVQIKNPYAFRCGEIAVNAVFCSEGNLLRESIASYLSAHKRNNES